MKESLARNDVKTRLYLFLGSTLTIVVVAAFLALLNCKEPAEYTRTPFQVLVILTVLACAALAAFFAKGPVFSIDGKLESGNINAMLITVLIIIQISFFFEIVFVRNQIINYQKYEDIRESIIAAETCPDEDKNATLNHLCKDGIVAISIVDGNDRVLFSSEDGRIGNEAAKSQYAYSFEESQEIRFYMDKHYVGDTLRTIILNLLTVLVTSIFFSVEMVLLMIRLILRNVVKEDEEEQEGGKMLSSLYYIRQIAFLFYFSSRLSAAFIPIVAKQLYNPFPWLSDSAAAGMPQSAETLLTCSAIFLTTLLLEKKGWKLPFTAGLFMVAAGTLLSAFSGNLILFVAARAVVGLGYGFCWMTLRNLSLFGRNNKEQLLGFALLNTGIYAGMNCGSSLGAILADLFGYKVVFMISAVMTVATSAFIIRMENAQLPKRASKDLASEEKTAVKQNFRHMAVAVLFVVLMIAPACIAASYTSYYLPLYFTKNGGSITDVGRAQLLYGLAIVYVGPFLSVIISSLKKTALKKVNAVYNMLIALSLFMPGIGAGLVLAFGGAALLGMADSFGFGVQNNYFLELPAIKKLGASRSLSILSFIKKILEMTGPLVFAFMITIGYQAGIRYLAVGFAAMAVLFVVACLFMEREEKQEE